MCCCVCVKGDKEWSFTLFLSDSSILGMEREKKQRFVCGPILNTSHRVQLTRLCWTERVQADANKTQLYNTMEHTVAI